MGGKEEDPIKRPSSSKGQGSTDKPTGRTTRLVRYYKSDKTRKQTWILPDSGDIAYESPLRQGHTKEDYQIEPETSHHPDRPSAEQERGRSEAHQREHSGAERGKKDTLSIRPNRRRPNRKDELK